MNLIKQKTSLFYHPTTVVFVDDDQSYLDKLDLNYGDLFPCKTFSDPSKAIEFLKNAQSIDTAVKRCIQIPIDKTSDQIASQFHIKNLVKELEFEERFQEVTIVVVDYSMPMMNGIELCKKLQDVGNFFFILLTGEADNDIAIKAFEQGLIHKFIKKGSPEASAFLMESIAELEQKSFLNLSAWVMSNTDSEFLDFLKNEAVSHFFDQFCEEYKVVEYYMLSDAGDFLLVSEAGETAFLTIKSEKKIQELHDYALINDGSKKTLEALKTKNAIPVFYAQEDFDPHPSDWESYLQKAQKTSETGYYYAYQEVNDKNASLFKVKPTYQDYLASY